MPAPGGTCITLMLKDKITAFASHHIVSVMLMEPMAGSSIRSHACLPTHSFRWPRFFEALKNSPRWPRSARQPTRDPIPRPDLYSRP